MKTFAIRGLLPALCLPLVIATNPANGADGAVARAADRATVQELMVTVVDPAADTLWDSVAYIANEHGVEDRRPRTDAEWNALAAAADRLIAGAQRLREPGRRVTDAPGGNPGPGELSVRQIGERLAADPRTFGLAARRLEATGRRARAAIAAHDPDGLLAAGGEIDAACEACHRVFWYPDQTRQGGPAR